MKVRDITLIGICAAILVAVQLALSFLPNVELVSLLIVLFTKHLRSKTLYVIYVFALAEGLIFGFNVFWLTYLYVWTMLYVVTWLLREMESAVGWAVILGIYGLLFGTLCSVPHFFLLGFRGGLAWIASGLYFDLLHCAGNAAGALLLYKPLDACLLRVRQQFAF